MSIKGFVKATLIAGGLSLSMASWASAQDTRIVEPDWKYYGGGFTKSNGEGFTHDYFIRYNVFDVNGKAQLCVAYASRGGRTTKILRAFLKEGSITADGRSIRRNILFGKQYSSRFMESPYLAGQVANCKTTKHDYASLNTANLGYKNPKRVRVSR